ncbi:MAG: aspartyl/glutamyl-tRNA amidotransferase subunit A [Deltaproteobacteria bacterium RIFCSPLOWO2_12_FULL_43_16]|nr:MAG: aspartyl/glutamyl-tRNA amidotransferase subunit A [Deltaproteobacteria bacterium RIFCSPHIGHO2_02_FULL_43_33]OGQ38289.1 MAG: aspartyl/glutamyl-tRNA amidotransferase subunit A [Deltaproteobacteria bacterium RIFCSPLOWO2_01_FULL_42_9]OGQ61015.1 MAG: aspartyl/glutamyl-tRNA amidotransferase subunit A [Deltaproteobacteria bacterium RIFCSPLOWO2_12_FULL_43_16]
MELYNLTIHELHEKLQKKEITSLQLTEAFLKRIEAVDGKIKAYITVTKEDSIKQAKEADKRLASGKDITPLTGVPISVKDIFCTNGVRTTCASKILNNFVPPYDAAVIKKLKDAGAVILGKNNMDEFAMGSSTENSAYFVTKNPWDVERVPGGSSGGSAASVAAGECTASIGTDTGGSIRQPASCCGIVGLKPTYGRVSRYGMIAFASSLDQAGPMTKDVTDCAIMMNTMAGYDPQDSTSIDAPVPDYTKALTKDVKGLKIGIPKEYFIKGLDSDVEKAVKDAIEVLKKQGASVVDISLPHTDYAIAVYYLVATAEASSNLARFDGVKFGHRAKDSKNLLDMYCKTRDEGFGPEVKRRIMLGTYSLSAGYYDAYYKKASQVRTLIKRDFEEVFKKCGVILTPTAPTPAFKIGEKTADPLTMYLSDIFTISCNLAGIPGLSLPCGFTKDNLPIGLQILGKPLDEETVLKTAYSYEQATEWHKKRAGVEN